MAEFRVHKVRFYEHKPEAIHCLKYNDKTNKIALSRTDNSIEIWDISEQPYQEKIIPSAADRSVESLAWCQNRLFSTGFLGDVTEYDLFRLKPKYSSLAAPNSCWCMSENSSQSHLAVGTEEGYICLFEVNAEKAEYERCFDKQEGKILCLAWHPFSEFIVSGSIDLLRIWDVKTGRAIQRIMVGRSEPRKQTFIWCVAFTRDYQVISGDSRGKVAFWDGKQGTQLDCFTSHKSDVLTLCVNKEEDRVCAAGVDPCVISFERLLSMDNSGSEPRNWVKTLVRAPHTHDVKAITFAGQYLASGGVDTYLSLMKYPAAYRWSYPSLPQSPTVHVAGKKNVVLLRYPDYLELWRLGTTTKITGEDGETLPLSSDPVKLVCLRAKPKEVIVCCTISLNCRWLAYGTASQIRIFQIIAENLESTIPSVSLQRIASGSLPSLYAHRMIMTPDEDKLIAATDDGRVQVMKLKSDGVTIINTLTPSSDPKDSIHLMSVSGNSKVLACGDHFSNITVFNIKKGEILCTLPRLDQQPTALAFHPTTLNLVVVYSNLKVVEYDVRQKQLTDWSRQSQAALSRWSCRKFPALNVAFDPRNDDVIIIHDDSRITVINKKEMMKAEVVRNKEQGKSQKKNRLVSKSPPSQDRLLPAGLHVVSDKYKHLLHFSVLEDGMALAVEVNEGALFESLPPALKKKKFGT